MTATDRRLALDVMAIIRNQGQARTATHQRLHADQGLSVFIETIGPAADGMNDDYDTMWHDFRQHVRHESRRLRLPEVDAVRTLLPLWRSQGRLLAAVRSAVKEAEAKAGDEGEGEAAAHSGADEQGIEDDEDGGGTGFGYGNFGA